MFNKEEYEKYQESVSEDEKRENIAVNLRRDKEYKKFEENMKDASKHEQFLQDRFLPRFVPFIKISDIENS